MKTSRILFVAVLLVASTALMAKTNARSFDKSKAFRQTEQLAKQLDLSKNQAQTILTINQDFSFNESLLFAQRSALLRLGYIESTVEQAFRKERSKDMEARNEAIKSVLNDKQLVAYDTMLPDLKKDLNKTIRFMRERTRERYDS